MPQNPQHERTENRGYFWSPGLKRTRLMLFIGTRFSNLYTSVDKVRTIRGCLGGLALMVWKSRMVLAAPGPLITPPPSLSVCLSLSHTYIYWTINGSAWSLDTITHTQRERERERERERGRGTAPPRWLQSHTQSLTHRKRDDGHVSMSKRGVTIYICTKNTQASGPILQFLALAQNAFIEMGSAFCGVYRWHLGTRWEHVY